MSNPMGLTIPTPNVTSGPDYASNVSDALTTIASHTHVTGDGNQVPTAGLNINADLTFGGFNATHLKSTQFTSQGSPLSSSFVSCLYVSGGELYYNDGNGTSIKFTQGGVFNASLVGAFTNLASTTGAATYDSVSGTFTFTSNTGVKATLAIGPLSIADTASNALSITIKSPTGLGSAYTLTLPGALPAAASVIKSSTAGALSFQAFDETTIDDTGTSIKVKDGGIGTTQLANSAVTVAKMAGSLTWNSVTPSANWSVPVEAGYAIDGFGIVHLRGYVQAGAGAGASPFTLPAGFRPGITVEMPSVKLVSGVYSVDVISIDTLGVVTVAATANGNETFFDGITFDKQG